MPAGRSRAPASRPPRRPAQGRPRATARVTAPEPPVEHGWRGRLTVAARNHRARRVLVLASILAFLAVLLGSTVAAYVGQRRDITALRDKVAAQEQDVVALEAERERWRDPAYVEQQARQRLKFVKPGERSYTVLDAEPTATNADPVTAVIDPAAPTLPWYEAVWQSTRTADAPGARR
jgi:cell division protein FtsB